MATPRFGFLFAATDTTKPGFSSVNKSLTDLVGGSNRTRQAVDNMNQAVSRSRNQLGRTNVGLINHRRMLQQVGFQVGDFATQMAGGQDAMLAFTQQGSQMLQFFGTFGALAAGVLAVVGSIAIAMNRAGASMESLTAITGVLTPAFVTLGNALSTVGYYAIEAANLIVNNFDRILIAAGLVATFMATRWVTAWIAGGGAVAFATRALTLLRTAILRLPIVGLLVVATEMVYQFTRLVQGAGSFAEALSLLKDLALEVWDRIMIASDAAVTYMNGGLYRFQAAALEVFGAVVERATSAYKLIATTWNAIAEVTGGTMINTDAIEVSKELTRASQRAAILADDMIALGNYGMDAATKPLASWAAIVDVLGRVNDKQIDVRDWFGKIEDEATGGGKGEKKKKSAAEEYAEKWLKAVKDIGDSLASHVGDGLMAITERTKSVTEAFRDMARDIIKELYDILVVQRVVAALSNAITGNGSAGGGWVGAMLKGANINPVKGMSPPGRAGGGNVRAGQLYRVNENTQRGAEYFAPKQDGQILRESEVNSGGGTVVVNQTFNLSAGVPEAVRAEVTAMLPRIKQATIDGVVQERIRGGALRRVM